MPFLRRTSTSKSNKQPSPSTKSSSPSSSMNRSVMPTFMRTKTNSTTSSSPTNSKRGSINEPRIRTHADLLRAFRGRTATETTWEPMHWVEKQSPVAVQFKDVDWTLPSPAGVERRYSPLQGVTEEELILPRGVRIRTRSVCSTDS